MAKSSVKSPKPAEAPRIRFSAPLLRPKAAASWLFLKLPQGASDRLPSRSMVSVEGVINRAPFRATLQPDGDGGHWMKVDSKLQRAAGVGAGDSVAIEMAPASEEPEPKIPADLRRGLDAAPAKVRAAWADITAVARRDYILWITSAKQAETRARRIEKACDMLASGKRRPCCFDRSGMYDKSMSCPVADGADV
jgi:hypothetical protein